MKNRLFKTALLLITLSGSLSNVYGMDQKALPGPSEIFERLKPYMPQIPSTSAELLSVAQKSFWLGANTLALGYLAKQGVDRYNGLNFETKKKIRNRALGTAGILGAATAGLAYFKRPLFDYFYNAAQENAPKIFSGVAQALSSPSTTALLTGCIAGIFFLRQKSSEKKITEMEHKNICLKADLAIENAGHNYTLYINGNVWGGPHKPLSKLNYFLKNYQFDQQPEIIDVLASKIIQQFDKTEIEKAVSENVSCFAINVSLINKLSALTKNKNKQ